MTLIYLVVVILNGTPAPIVQQMPTMASCESVGKAIAAMQRVKWTCLETPL